ncbi:sulfotransferase 1A1-like [Saccoglossus kowalevskii]|uniref:Sulfotransferase 1A1-like n=1 Tax=Saccoglossus kowalevskii TaxID=10224 RepID=A0ABM0GRN2_SACKO|nr:PREDICTED: sulfotransferase 1A1-like [Saccoglossus kowalevskii]
MDSIQRYKGYTLCPYTDTSKLENGVLEKFLRQDDIIVQGFPKSGNTWMIFLLQELYPDLNVFQHGDKKVPPMLEWLTANPRFFDDFDTPITRAVKSFLIDPGVTSSPRLIKSHLPYELFPKQALRTGTKVIYIARNPKDVVTSSYHWLGRTNLPRENVTREGHLKNFIDGILPGTPWVNHVAGWRKHSDDENVFYVTYEDMVKETKTTVRAITEFLGRSLPDSQLENAIVNTSIDNLRNNPTSAFRIDIDESFMPNYVAGYFRKGKVGDWKNHFTVAENEMFEDVIVKKLQEKGIEFVYEL